MAGPEALAFDMEPGLTRLQERGHTMIVLSNGSPEMLDAIMDAAGLRPYFDTCGRRR